MAPIPKRESRHERREEKMLVCLRYRFLDLSCLRVDGMSDGPRGACASVLAGGAAGMDARERAGAIAVGQPASSECQKL